MIVHSFIAGYSNWIIFHSALCSNGSRRTMIGAPSAGSPGLGHRYKLVLRFLSLHDFGYRVTDLLEHPHLNTFVLRFVALQAYFCIAPLLLWWSYDHPAIGLKMNKKFALIWIDPKRRCSIADVFCQLDLWSQRKGCKGCLLLRLHATSCVVTGSK